MSVATISYYRERECQSIAESVHLDLNYSSLEYHFCYLLDNHKKVCVPEVPHTVQDETISAPYGR